MLGNGEMALKLCRKSAEKFLMYLGSQACSCCVPCSAKNSTHVEVSVTHCGHHKRLFLLERRVKKSVCKTCDVPYSMNSAQKRCDNFLGPRTPIFFFHD